MYIVSTKDTMMYILQNINGLIRLKVSSFKVSSFKEACLLYNIDYIEANYNIELYDPYFAGLVETDGSIVFNYASNRIEYNLEFQYNEYTSKLNLDNTLSNSKSVVYNREKTLKISRCSKYFRFIAFKFQIYVNSMLFVYDYFLDNRLYCGIGIKFY